MKEHKTLQSWANFRSFPQLVHYAVDHLFANGVMTSRIIVSGIFFTGDQCIGMKEVPSGKDYFIIKSLFSPWLKLGNLGDTLYALDMLQGEKNSNLIIC